jgi:hypothetical protein
MKDNFNHRKWFKNQYLKEADTNEGIFDIERDRKGADFFELIDPNRGVLITGTKQDIMEYLWENTELEIKQIK